MDHYVKDKMRLMENELKYVDNNDELEAKVDEFIERFGVNDVIVYAQRIKEQDREKHKVFVYRLGLYLESELKDAFEKNDDEVFSNLVQKLCLVMKVDGIRDYIGRAAEKESKEFFAKLMDSFDISEFIELFRKFIIMEIKNGNTGNALPNMGYYIHEKEQEYEDCSYHAVVNRTEYMYNGEGEVSLVYYACKNKRPDVANYLIALGANNMTCGEIDKIFCNFAVVDAGYEYLCVLMNYVFSKDVLGICGESDYLLNYDIGSTTKDYNFEKMSGIRVGLCSYVKKKFNKLERYILIEDLQRLENKNLDIEYVENKLDIVKDCSSDDYVEIFDMDKDIGDYSSEKDVCNDNSLEFLSRIRITPEKMNDRHEIQDRIKFEIRNGNIVNLKNCMKDYFGFSNVWLDEFDNFFKCCSSSKEREKEFDGLCALIKEDEALKWKLFNFRQELHKRGKFISNLYKSLGKFELDSIKDLVKENVCKFANLHRDVKDIFNRIGMEKDYQKFSSNELERKKLKKDYLYSQKENMWRKRNFAYRIGG